MRLLAIDFGTSNTVAALLVDGQAPRTVTFDTSPLLPSAVFVGADGQVTVGRDAQRQARLDPARYEPNPKRRIDDGEILLGDRVVPVVDVIAAVLRVVSIEVRRQLGGAAPDEVRLTHPAQWGATRQNLLVSAARAAGLGANLLLIPEPVAAAAQFTRLPGRALPPGGTVAVYDLGGGTFDIAIVGRTQSGGPGSGSPGSAGSAGPDTGEFHVLAEAGLADLGGLDFDQAILDQVGRTTSSIDPGRWQNILRPTDSPGRRAARALAEDVRAAKETLSRYPQTDVSLPDPFLDAHLTRTEFEGLIRPNLLRSIEVLSSVLRNAGIVPERLGGIFLVGGSSRIPLVAGLIQERLHVTPVALDQPETAVALGALLVPVNRGSARTVGIGDPSSPFGGWAPGPATGPGSAGGTAPGNSTGGGSAAGGAAASGAAASGAAASGAPGGSTGGIPTVGGSMGWTGRTGSSTGRTPAGPGSPSGPLPTQTAKSRFGGRRGLLVAGGSVVVIVIALVLVIIRPFGAKPAPDPVSDPTGGPASSSLSGSSPSTSSGSSVSSGSSGSSGSSVSSGGGVATTGLGPGKVFTAGEVGFLSNNANALSQCSDITSAFNGAVKGSSGHTFDVGRALRCTVDDQTLDSLYGSAFVYVMTVKDALAAQTYLDAMYKARINDASGGSKQDSDVAITTGVGGHVMTVYDLPSFGHDPSDVSQGASVLAWAITGQPYVGIVVSLSPATQSDLNTYWAENFKPRS